MKKLSVILLIMVFTVPAIGQNWFEGTLDEALEKAKSENKRVLIDFYGSS